MSLTDELGKLHDLQQVDYQIYKREQAIKALDSGEGLKQTAISLLKRHDLAKTELQKAEGALKNHELELKTVETKRATVHEKLYSGRVNNPKELGDLQKDEEMLDTQIGTIEEVVLELMEQAENARTIEATLANELSDAKRKWQQTVAHTKAETARLQQEIAAMQPERTTLAAAVEPMLLRRYDEIRVRREGVGMGVTGNDLCPICHMKLSTNTMNRLRDAEELTLCDSCGRILAKG